MASILNPPAWKYNYTIFRTTKIYFLDINYMKLLLNYMSFENSLTCMGSLFFFSKMSHADFKTVYLTENASLITIVDGTNGKRIEIMYTILLKY